MTKYTIASQRRARREEQSISPIWRGIGCFLILIVPLGSYLLANLAVNIAVSQNWPMPYQLMGYPVMPTLLFKLPGLVPVLTFIQAQQYLYAILLIALIFTVAFGALISYIWAVGSKYMGPPRYGPLDAPPLKANVKRYKR
jgi:hypothetical protein